MNLDLTGSIVLYENNPDVLLSAVNSFLETNLNVRLFNSFKTFFTSDNFIFV